MLSAVLLAIVLLLGIAWSSTQRGLAALRFDRSALVEDRDAGIETSVDDYKHRIAIMEQGLLRHDSDPEVLDALGRAYTKLASEDQPSLRKANNRRARDYFRKSVMLRPVSPYSWANLAVSNMLLNEFGPELELAMSRVAEYGRRVEQPLRLVIANGLRFHYQLTSNQRRIRQRLLAEYVRTAPYGAYLLAKQYHAVDQLCSLEEARQSKLIRCGDTQ